MASKRKATTLHGVNSIEKTSPLKNQFGKRLAGENNIRGDGNYVDVEWTTVLTSKRYKHETNCGSISHDVSSEAMSTCQRADNIEFCAMEDFPEKDESIFQDNADTHENCEMNMVLSNEFLEVEAGGGECKNYNIFKFHLVHCIYR